MLPPFDPWQSAAIAFDVVAAGRADAAGIELRRRRRLRELLGHAARHSALWRGRLRDVDLDAPDLNAIEPIGKPELMRRFEAWVTDPRLTLDSLTAFAADPSRIGEACVDGCLLWTSSGSTGTPGLFVQDARALAVYDALDAWRRAAPGAMRRWFGAWPSADRLAFVGATGGHYASTVSVERMRRLLPALAEALRGFSFLQPIGELTAQLDGFSPAVLATYPTMALVLAAERRAGRLSIAPQEVWTGGETLTPAMRREIESAFGCPVGNSYGASECLAIATEGACGALHLNADWVIVEPIDERGRPVPDGVPSHSALVTNLANRVQPLIRYDIGDRITLHPGRCECGSWLPRIEVEGRHDDLLVLGPRRRPVRVAPLVVAALMEDGAGVFDFQLEQTGPAALVLRVAPSGGGRPALARGRALLLQHLHGLGLASVTIAGECAPPRRGVSGKVRRVIGLPADQ